MNGKSIDSVETVEKLSLIISVQSEIINELFVLLMQHISAEEADKLPAIKKINQAAEIRSSIGLQEGESTWKII